MLSDNTIIYRQGDHYAFPYKQKVVSCNHWYNVYVSLSEETTIMFDELMAQSLMAAAAHRVSGQSKKWGGQES